MARKAIIPIPFISVYSLYHRKAPDEGPAELQEGDIIIVDYFSNTYRNEEGIKTADFEVIEYGTKENLSKFMRQSQGKVQELIDSLSDDGS